MPMENIERLERGVKIVGGIANTAAEAGMKFTFKEINALLTLFECYSSDNTEYASPGRLVVKARDKYEADGDLETAKNIDIVFRNGIDLSLLEK
ncbi:hypothetical protein FACS189476_02700 [Spirochaetia bacterium]|nr:hypothetical protein FACS189476_02700 [Spirochaetia bacterium]